MKNRDEQQEIRSSLNQDVFSKYQFKSQQEEIIKRATEVTKAPKKEKYYYYGLSGVAVILFSIVALSYILASGTDKAPASPTDQEEETDTEQIEDTHHEYIADPDFPLTPHKRVEPVLEDEKTEPAQVERTEEEWKAYFKGLYNEQREEIQKLHLKYESQYHDDSTYEIEITTQFEENEFIERDHTTQFKNGVKLTEYTEIATHEGTIIIDHVFKEYIQDFGPTTVDEFKEYKTLYTVEPVYQLHDTEFEGYQWTLLEQNLDENWILLELTNTDPQVLLYERGIIKVEYNSGIILEKTKYNREKITTFTLKELRINDELPDLTIDGSIPEDYTDMKGVVYQERANINEDLFYQAKEKVMKNNDKIQEIVFSGEGDHLSFAMSMQEGVSSTEGQETGEKFIEEFTIAANASAPFRKKDTTVWAEGQYDFTIRVNLPETEFLIGEYEDSQIMWESKAYAEY